jgi:ATP-dependent helicase/nuclease subunit A
MHKAKGLEFGICYLAGLYKRFQNPDKREPFIFSKEYGILTKAYNDGFYENFLRKLYFKKDDEEDLSERIRLLYVAMTRAINKLVIVMDYDEELLTESKALTSFKNILYRYLKLNEITPEVIDLTVEVDRKISLKKTDKLIERKNFKFNKEILDKVTYSKTIDQVLSDEIKAAIKAGDEYHHLLETIDFNNFTESIKDFPNFLKESLNNFINTEIIKNLIEPIYYQEYEFYQIKDEVVYRGVIDLLIIDKDKVYAIDYKLKNIDDLAYEKQLKGYYDYLSDKLDKPIKLFLYSLSNKVLKEINL